MSEALTAPLKVHDHERMYVFDCPEMGLKGHPPKNLMPGFYRYMWAFSKAADMPEDSRGSYLDYGCGTGWGTELVGSTFRTSVGFDASHHALEYAALVHHRARTHYTNNRTAALSFGPFDFITFFECIEHVGVEDGEKMVADVAGVLGSRATLLVSTPVATTKDGLNPNNPFHLHEYQPGELKALLEKYFMSVEISLHLGMMMIAVCRVPRR